MLQWNKTRKLAATAMLSAIIIILAITPLGLIQLPFIKATVLHIPVIIGSILLGMRYGSALGALFGLCSLVSNTTAPTVSSFVFTPAVIDPTTGYPNYLSLVVCFVPRILVGVTPRLVFNIGRKISHYKFNEIWYAISGLLGSLTNTLLVMHFIYFFFATSYSFINKMEITAVYSFILGIIAANGIPEAIVAAIFTTAVCSAIFRTIGKNFK